MANTQSQGFPPGFVEQVTQFLKLQQEEGVERLVCYDRDENVELTITLPATDVQQAAADYRKAWQLWREGGTVLRIRRDPPAGAPQNEARQPFESLPDFGLE